MSAEKTVKAANVNKIADDLSERLAKRLDRLAMAMEETAASELAAIKADEERPADFAAAFLEIFAHEVNALAEESASLVKLVRDIAA